MDKYFKFDGLATRSEYWGVQLVGLGLLLVLMLVSGILLSFAAIVGIILILAVVVSYIWVVLATTVRRCRDAGINPWWTASTLIPYIGFIPWIVIGVLSTVKNDQT